MSVLIQLTDGVKSFGDQMLLDNANVTLYEDEKVGFIGRNGAGKSTLLNVLYGDIKPESGVITTSKQHTIGFLKHQEACLKNFFFISMFFPYFYVSLFTKERKENIFTTVNTVYMNITPYNSSIFWSTGPPLFAKGRCLYAVRLH